MSFQKKNNNVNFDYLFFIYFNILCKYIDEKEYLNNI